MARGTRKSQADQAVELLKQHGAMRCSELGSARVHPETLARLVEDGSLVRVARGLYQLADTDITAPHTLAEVAKLVPKGVICLISALQFHELTLQMPSRVWVAIGAKARKPKFEYPAIRVVRFGSRALSLGVEVHRIDGVAVPINPCYLCRDFAESMCLADPETPPTGHRYTTERRKRRRWLLQPWIESSEVGAWGRSDRQC